MRTARCKISGETAVYHCITRVVGGEMLLHRREKEVLRKMLWQVAAFCGVEVMGYCVMSNHFHVLVRVSEDIDLSRTELIRRYRALYQENCGPNYPDPDVLAMILEEDSEEAEMWVDRLSRRMGDVSEFMKTLKQRFSVWYNKSHNRYGTLWAERFKSTVIENDPVSLKVVAAYIDLNPVRAGLVEDPADYRWSTYGEAMGGSNLAQSGLSSVLNMCGWGEAAESYRMVLYGKGAVGRVGEQGIIPREKVVEILNSGGRVPQSSLLRCRMRYLTDGAIFGSREFVSRIGSKLYGGRTTREPPDSPLGGIADQECDQLVVWRRLRFSPVD